MACWQGMVKLVRLKSLASILGAQHRSQAVLVFCKSPLGAALHYQVAGQGLPVSLPG